jgi:hypothetical protein
MTDIDLLARRYRSILVASYPVDWRERNEDAVLGTLLDEAEVHGRSRPRIAEVLTLLVHGAGARLRGPGGLLGRDLRDRVSLLAFAMGTAVALVSIGFVEWRPWLAQGPTSQGAAPLDPGSFALPPHFGPFASSVIIVDALWLAALLARLVRWHLVGRVALLLTIPVAVLIRAGLFDTDVSVNTAGHILAFLGLLAAVAAAGGSWPRRSTAIAVAIGVIALCTAVLIEAYFTGWAMYRVEGAGVALWATLTSWWLALAVVRPRWAAATVVFSAAVAVCAIARTMATGAGDSMVYVPIVLELVLASVLIGYLSGFRVRVSKRS